MKIRENGNWNLRIPIVHPTPFALPELEPKDVALTWEPSRRRSCRWKLPWGCRLRLCTMSCWDAEIHLRRHKWGSFAGSSSLRSDHQLFSLLRWRVRLSEALKKRNRRSVWDSSETCEHNKLLRLRIIQLFNMIFSPPNKQLTSLRLQLWRRTGRSYDGYGSSRSLHAHEVIVFFSVAVLENSSIYM